MSGQPHALTAQQSYDRFLREITTLTAGLDDFSDIAIMLLNRTATRQPVLFRARVTGSVVSSRFGGFTIAGENVRFGDDPTDQLASILVCVERGFCPVPCMYHRWTFCDRVACIHPADHPREHDYLNTWLKQFTQQSRPDV